MLSKPLPSTPNPVEFFVSGLLLAAVPDDAAVCSASMTHESTLLGNCEIAKFSGTCSVSMDKKQSVRTSFGGVVLRQGVLLAALACA